MATQTTKSKPQKYEAFVQIHFTTGKHIEARYDTTAAVPASVAHEIMGLRVDGKHQPSFTMMAKIGNTKTSITVAASQITHVMVASITQLSAQ